MYQINNKEETFEIPKLDKITIKGSSRSAYRTGYLIQPYNIYLDAGHPSPVPPSMVLLSHGHHDHVASLYSILINSDKTVPVLIPSCLETNIQEMLNAFYTMNNGKKSIYDKWTPVKTKSYTTIINSKNISIDVFNLDHRVRTHGYGIKQIHKRLKEDYIGKSGKELAELKKTTDITFEIKIPMLLFISDTGKKVLPNLPFSEYPLVIIECTFFEEEHYEESISRKHLHWKDLEPFVKANPETKFILGHFSCRYKNEYLEEKEAELKLIYSNIIFWI